MIKNFDYEKHVDNNKFRVALGFLILSIGFIFIFNIDYSLIILVTIIYIFLSVRALKFNLLLEDLKK